MLFDEIRPVGLGYLSMVESESVAALSGDASLFKTLDLTLKVVNRSVECYCTRHDLLLDVG